MYELQTRAGNVFNMMQQRCFNPKFTGYHNYGARGISIDKEWLDNPTAFFNWYKAHWFDGGQVDRIDNDGNYSESNCRMVDAKTNSRNRRTTAKYEAFGESKNLAEWAEDPRCFENDWRNLHRRVHSGISLELAMSKDYRSNKYAKSSKTQRNAAPQITAFGESKSLADWADDPRCTIEKRTLHARLKDNWPAEDAIVTPKNGRYRKM